MASSPVIHHQLRVSIVEAQGITATNDWNSGSDSFCEVRMNDRCTKTQLRTATQKQTVNPKWQESFQLDLSPVPINDIVSIYVFGEKMLGSKVFIGRVEIPVTLLLHGAPFDGWFKLLPHADMSRSVDGHIRMQLQYQPLQRSHQQQHQQVVVTSVVPKPNHQQAQSQTHAVAVKRGSAAAYPGNKNKNKDASAKRVACPVCCKTFLPNAINAHLDTCVDQSKPAERAAACPVCNEMFPASGLQQHVDSCLTNQEQQDKREQNRKLVPTNESQEHAQFNAVLIASQLQNRGHVEASNNNEKEQESTSSTHVESNAQSLYPTTMQAPMYTNAYAPPNAMYMPSQQPHFNPYMGMPYMPYIQQPQQQPAATTNTNNIAPQQPPQQQYMYMPQQQQQQQQQQQMAYYPSSMPVYTSSPPSSSSTLTTASLL